MDRDESRSPDLGQGVALGTVTSRLHRARLRCRVAVLLLPLLLLAVAAGPVAAQSEAGDAARGLWATAGLGYGTRTYAGLLALNVASGPHLLSLRATDDSGITTGPSQGDIGLLYGRMKRWSRAYVQASIGVAYVFNDFEDDPRLAPRADEPSDGPGIPLSVGGAWTPLPVLGVGLQAFGNVNGTEFFGGVLLTAQVGWVP